MNKRNTYTGPFSSACDQASKLGLGKNNKIVCFYEKYQVSFFSNNKIVCFYEKYQVSVFFCYCNALSSIANKIVCFYEKNQVSVFENEKCLFSNTQEFLHNIFMTCYK